MKIRGTAAHIAEKYATLARDAAASGDSITAENYLQHAEHYNRIIMAAQAQLTANAQPSPDGANGGGGNQRHRRPQGTDDGARVGNEAFGAGDDMDEAGEPMRSADTGGQPSQGDGGGGRRRRANGGDNDAEAEPRAEDTSDTISA